METMYLLWWLCVTLAAKWLIGTLRVLKCIFLQIWKPYLAVNLNEILMHVVYLFWWLCIYYSGPKIIKDLNSAKMLLRRIFHPNLVILPWIGGDQLRGEAQNTSDPNLVIPARTEVELLRGNPWLRHTQMDGWTHTDRRRQQQYLEPKTCLG